MIPGLDDSTAYVPNESCTADDRLMDYATAIERVQIEPSDRTVLAVALARQNLVPLLSGSPDTSIVLRIAQLDDSLRAQIFKLVDAVSTGGLSRWRETVSPSPSAWWWRLDDVAAQQRSQLWAIGTGLSIAISISLLGVISSRFWSVGPDLVGVALVVLQAVLALLASSAMTEFASRQIGHLLARLGFKPSRHALVKLGFGLSAIIMALGLRLSLPWIAKQYNASGYDHQKHLHTALALEDFQRAISLNPDYSQAHYNLGTAFEDIGDYEKAIVEYQTAVRDDPRNYHAFNNIGRLYISYKKDYFAALNVLMLGVRLRPIEPTVRYTFHKNLGWTNLMLKNYDQAHLSLNAAISDYESGAEAHCMLAEVYEAELNAANALVQWKLCAVRASQDKLAAPAWGVIASEHLKQKEQRR